MNDSNLEESIFYDAKDEEQFKNMKLSLSSTNSDQNEDNYYETPLAMTQSHIYQTTCQYEFSSSKIDPNIEKSYRILSCSRSAKNIIHITHKTAKSNIKKSSIHINTGLMDITTNDSLANNDEDKNNTSIEIKLNEWTFDIELENLCLMLLPKNLETIMELVSNLTSSFSPVSEDNSNNKTKSGNAVTSISNTSIQENSLPGSFPSININQFNKRPSSQSLSVKLNKKPKQRNNIFTFKFNLKNFIVFIANDEEEKICLPYFDYNSFLDELFDSSNPEDVIPIDGLTDDFLKVKSPGEMLNEYHLKMEVHNLSFQINIISNKYYNIINSNNNINKRSKDSRQTDISTQYSISSVSLSEWIDGILIYIMLYILLKKTLN